REAGFDSVFAYNSGVKSDYEQCVNPGEPTIDYSIMMRNQRHCYEQIAKGGMPFFPSVTLGLDVSPRWSREVKYPWDYEKLGYYPIMVNNTPDRIAELLRDALSFDTEAVIINAWNEWTEGMFLLPDNHDGSERLDKIKEVLEIYNQ
ncbi:MAG: glycoside hydrolase family 99-like domain-containing protein, partial [Lentisphaeria bacterium]|nr:glycoside hydrolase family 99-like domain-containing protein [Lentisphaeria bacterium]